MSFRADAFRLLDHLGKTITVRALHEDRGRADAVALRHDVDHDLDLALELAHHEHARGMRATYFLLHTHPYVQDPLFVEKCRQLVDYGHEIGVHVNALTPWTAGETDDPIASVRAFLARLRDAGVEVVGVAAHGDRACYERGFSNLWLWRELRGDDPAAREAGRSAEGIAVDDPKWQLPYPADHRLRRADGAEFPLWSGSLAELGLAYEACRVPHDRYWTDSGGGWTRSGDPVEADLSRGRHQVLVHPIWWRDEGRIVFVLSTARCATKWLTARLAAGTSAGALHEWTLNHRRAADGPGYVAEKRTHEDFRWFEEEPARVRSLLVQAVRHHRALKRDVVECNVYLASFLDELREVCPDAVLVHLHRDPGAVVRSLLERGWYASPDDRRRPQVARDVRWAKATQFGRACMYWADVNARLLEAVPDERRFAIETLVARPEAFADLARSIGLVVHPRLLRLGFAEVVDAGGRDVPAAEAWPARERSALAGFCNDVAARLGRPAIEASSARSWLPRLLPPRAASPRVAWDAGTGGAGGAAVECAIVAVGDAAFAVAAQPKAGGAMTARNAHAVLMRDASWSVGAGAPPIGGFDVVSGRLDCRLEGAEAPRVFLLFYGADGRAAEHRQVGTLRSAEATVAFAEAVPAGATRVALAIHLGAQPAGARVVVESGSVRLERAPRGYAVDLA